MESAFFLFLNNPISAVVKRLARTKEQARSVNRAVVLNIIPRCLRVVKKNYRPISQRPFDRRNTRNVRENERDWFVYARRFWDCYIFVAETEAVFVNRYDLSRNENDADSGFFGGKGTR